MSPEIVAVIVKFFTVILAPFNFAFMGLKALLSKIFKSSGDKSITEEELITIIDEAETGGGIDKHESELIRSAIEFNDLDVVDIIKPRVQVVAVSSDMSPEEILKVFDDNGFSRLPVYNDDIDNIVGVINEKDFHKSYGKITDIKSITKPILYTTPTTKISALLRQLQKQKSHIAIVIDEYGGTLGIVTLEDILEELVGEIWDEHDEVIEPIKRVGENTYRVLCTTSLDDMFKFFRINRNGKDYVSNTVSGWVIEELGRLPAEGSSSTGTTSRASRLSTWPRWARRAVMPSTVVSPVRIHSEKLTVRRMAVGWPNSQITTSMPLRISRRAMPVAMSPPPRITTRMVPTPSFSAPR